MTDSDLLTKAKAAKLMAEASAIKVRQGELITKAEHEKQMAELKIAIFAEIWQRVAKLPAFLQKNGLIKKSEMKRALALMDDFLSGLK